MKRRDFLKAIAALTACGSVGRVVGASSGKRATDRIVLGPRQISVSRMFVGTGTGGWGGNSDQSRELGISGLAALLCHASDQGVTGWDTADQYGTHPHVREALKNVPREGVTILTKTRARTADEVRADLDRFRRELGTDYIDILLLHCLTDPRWPEKMRQVMDVIDEAQEKGVVRTKGVSCHSLGALQAAANEPWVEVDLARINPAGKVMDAEPATVATVLKEMKSHGKGVIGMKLLAAGGLTDRVSECLDYAKSLECIDAFTIGCRNRGQFDDLLRRMT
ncbi:MAG TPA: aldo/keto reductase [Terrimicrobiaceae bacterium]